MVGSVKIKLFNRDNELKNVTYTLTYKVYKIINSAVG
jgi:hypothetical protein